MALTTVSTQIKISKKVAERNMTPGQYCWLKHAIEDYNITLDLNTINTVGEASKHITHIQSAINSGKLTKSVAPAPVTPSIWYAVILTDRVFIKTFVGTRVEAVAKSYRAYGSDVQNVTDIIDDAKSIATQLRNNLIADEVAVTTTTDTELTMDALNVLSIEDLRKLAFDMGVDLGRSKARNTIIARILA